MARRRPKMETAFQWIAANDNPGDPATLEEIGGWITVLLVSDLWGMHPLDVAAAVELWRARFSKTPPNSVFDEAIRLAITDKR